MRSWQLNVMWNRRYPHMLGLSVCGRVRSIGRARGRLGGHPSFAAPSKRGAPTCCDVRDDPPTGVATPPLGVPGGGGAGGGGAAGRERFVGGVPAFASG